MVNLMNGQDLTLDPELLRRAVEQSSTLVILTDAEARITYVNARFTEVTGYTREEVMGRNPRFLQSGRTPPVVYQSLWASLLAGGCWRGELENRRKNGEPYWVSAAISAVRDERGRTTHYLGVQDDVTARHHVEEALMRLQAELEQRVRDRTAELATANRELERFNHTVAHDLRGALRTVSAFADMLGDDHGHVLDLEGRELLGRLSRAAHHAGDIVRGLEQLAHIQHAPLDPAPVDVARMVREVAGELGAPAGLVHVAEGAAVEADAALLRVALTNLIGNALKFSRDAAAPRVDVSVDGDGVLCVRDNGVGIAAEEAEALFEWSARGRGASGFPGTGIGLATVRRIAERHGGWVRAAPAPGGGALFRLRLRG